MIIWHPSKECAQKECLKKLALVVTKDYERILIGDEQSIIRRLEGEQNVEVDYDVRRPFGTVLLLDHYDEEKLWNEAIMDLEQARQIVWGNIVEQIKTSAVNLEKHAQEILQEKYDTGDPLCQYAAMRIWNEHWALRGQKSKKKDGTFVSWAHNLVRPFLVKNKIETSRKRIDSSNPIFKKTRELYSCDKESKTRTVGGNDSAEYLIISDSFVPIEHYYKVRFEKWKKYIILCKVCKKMFIANSLRYELCSEECQTKMQEKRQEVRKKNPAKTEVDKLLAATNASWNNRRRKMKESPDWTEEEVLKYTIAMEHFQAERRKKRQAHKKGEITFNQLRDWAISQQVEAENVLQSLKNAKK